MQVNVPFFESIDNGKKFLISDSIIVFCRCHFFRDKCNWVEKEKGWIPVPLCRLLGP